MQMFRTPVSSAMQGDRVGVCVTQFDPKLLERGVVCTPGSLRSLHAALISTRKIGYFKGALATRAKFHVTVGHDTVMAKVTFFGLLSPTPSSGPAPLDTPFSYDREYLYQESYVVGPGGAAPDPEQWALLEFERPVTCPSLCLVIGSKLDTDIHANACRLAFQGRLLEGFQDKTYAETALPRLRIAKMKHKEGQVERVSGAPSVSVDLTTRVHGLHLYSASLTGGHSKRIHTFTYSCTHSPVHAHIHTAVVVSAMQGDIWLVGSS